MIEGLELSLESNGSTTFDEDIGIINIYVALSGPRMEVADVVISILSASTQATGKFNNN